MTLGKHPESVPEPFRIAANRVTTTDAFPRFRNIAAKLDLDTMSLAGGAIADDFDGDNQIDIVVSNWDTDGQLEFFRNRGDGSFQRQTEKANLVGIVGGLNLNHADFDNDGDLDLFVMRGGWLGTNGSFPNSLLENSGSGVFRDVTFESGLGVDFFPTQTSAWADYDNDGDDLPDLYVSNLGGPNRLYFNQGNGTFVDLAGESGVATPKNGFPAWFWDFNNDGNLDLYASSFEQGLEHIAGDYLGIEPKLGIDAHYLGDGKGGFIDVAQRIGLTAVTQPMGCNFGDLDNDGFLDFYLATGYPAVEGIMPNLMYLNDNGQSFVDVSNAGGFGHLQKGHGVAFADFDHDGDQDVLSELGGWCAGDRFQNALYENPGFDNNWIKIQLRGEDSNRFGVGARIRLVLGQGDSQRSIYRWVGYGSSFGGNPLRQEIGVGKTEVIDLLEVYWPRSGDSQQFKNVSVNQLIQIQETKADLEVTDFYSAAPVCSPSRVGLLTGRSPNRAGVYDWIPEARKPMPDRREKVHMRQSEVTIGRLLKSAGYQTCMAGKLHCNSQFNNPKQPQPGDFGFDHWMATQNNAAPSHVLCKRRKYRRCGWQARGRCGSTESARQYADHLHVR
jgi:hypothetical protein